MQMSDIKVLFAYNYWATGRILRAAAHLPVEQLVARDHRSRSLRGILVHMLSAEWIWRKRCQERVSPAAMLDEEAFPDLQSLQARWQAEETAMRAFLETLTDQDLDARIEYQRTGGARCSNTLWHLLAHLVNHGTQHRSEAAERLTTLGRSPGDLDLVLFLRDGER